MTAKSIQTKLTTQTLGRRLHTFDTLPSTSDHLKSLAAEDAPHGTAVIARHQSAGRGRRGRVFYSPKGDGVYMSVLLSGPIPATQSGRITCAAAVAVAEAIESLIPTSVQIKWVNDLLIDGKKVCGILTEGELNPATGTLDHAVLGIGINLSTADFPPELRGIATSLVLATGVAPDPAALIAAVLNRLEEVLNAIDTGDFFEEYRRRCVVLGKTVTVLRGNEHFSARALAVDDDGWLQVQTDTGTVTLSSGEVSIRL